MTSVQVYKELASVIGLKYRTITVEFPCLMRRQKLIIQGRVSSGLPLNRWDTA